MLKETLICLSKWSHCWGQGYHLFYMLFSTVPVTMPETQRLLDLLREEQGISHHKASKSSQSLLNQYLSHAKVLICWLIYSSGSISHQWEKETEYSNPTIAGKRNSKPVQGKRIQNKCAASFFLHFDPVAWWRIRQSQVHWILTNVVFNTPIICHTCGNCYQVST